MTAPTIVLNNGLRCPQFGLGTRTWSSAPGEIKEVVKYAIDVGYRHLDSAWIYTNEKEVGEAIRDKLADKTVKREDLFVVTKLWNIFHEKDQVVPACKESLKNLGLEYIDLYLMHWPVAQKSTAEFDIKSLRDAPIIDYDFVLTWKGLEECVKLGLTKSIGVSNFNINQLKRILDAAKIKPVMNQVEIHPNLTQKKLIKFCKDHGVEITAYSPFGSPGRPWSKPGDPVLSLNDPRFISIGKKYGKTSSQVVLRYLVQIGTIPIPQSSNKERIKQNIDVFDFNLSSEDMAVIDSFNCDGRVVQVEQFKESPEYPFKDSE